MGFKYSGSSESWSAYKRLRESFNLNVGNERRKEEAGLCQKIKSQPKIFWAHLNLRRKVSARVRCLRKDGVDCLEEREMAESFAEYFEDVFVKEKAGPLPEGQDWPPNRRVETFDPPPLTEIEEEIGLLKAGKSPRTDCIPTDLLLSTKSEISKPLSFIFRKSL
jgi:hypothetical protein